jgi:hypothetical protein
LGPGPWLLGISGVCFSVVRISNIANISSLGAIHKLSLQEKGGRWSKNSFFTNFHTIENVNYYLSGGIPSLAFLVPNDLTAADF